MSLIRNPARPAQWVIPGTLALGAVVFLLVAASVVAFAALAGARSVAQGESNWTRNQKDLVVGLHQYAATDEPRWLARAEEAAAFHATVQDVLDLVEEGEASRAELEAVTSRVGGFQGEARPFARAFVWFRGFSFVDVVTAEWGQAQRRVAELSALLPELRAAVGADDDDEVTRILARAGELDVEIEAFRGRFFEASDRWARAALQGSRATLLLLALLLLVAGSWGLVSVLRRFDRSERALEESRDRFRQVTEGIHEVFWLSSPDKSEMLYVSPAYEKVWGEPVEEASRIRLGWMARIVPEDRERVLEAVSRQPHDDVEVEYRIRTPEGELRWIRERSFPVRDATGAVVRIAGISENVTDRKAFEAEFLEAQKLRTVARLAAGVGHEFNNVLTAIRSHTEFLSEDLGRHPGLARDTAPDLKGIRVAAERAGVLTRQLLAFGRQQVVRPEPVGLDEFLPALRPLLDSLAPRDVDLAVEVAPGTPPVQVDRSHLREALLSLVANSVEAMNGGGGSRVTVVARPLSEPEVRAPLVVEGRVLEGTDFALIEVTDDGPGMPEALRARVFEPFFWARDGAGTQGLGLPALLGLMDQLGGGIALESAPGEGTRVRLYVPVARIGPEAGPGT
jgi:PAS domain S-box-containing protein